MNNINKRGISAVVATVLIILITVAAVTIIWAAIIPMINNQLEEGTLCLDAVSQVTIVDEGYTCYDSSDSNVSIQIAHGAEDFLLADMQMLISEGGDTTSILLVGSGVYTLNDLPGVNEEKVLYAEYSNTTIAGPSKVEIAPVVKIGNTQETCEISSSVVLRACN